MDGLNLAMDVLNSRKTMPSGDYSDDEDDEDDPKLENYKRLYKYMQNFLNAETPNESSNLNDFTLMLQQLERRSNFDRIRLTKEISKAEFNGFTLVQHCCIHEGLTSFLRALLDAYVDPNEVLDGTSRHANVNSCVLLAAENGNSEVLQMLIDYNNTCHLQEQDYMNTLNSGKKGMKEVRKMMKNKKVECKFDIWTKNQETVLHLLLKRPLLKKLKDTYRHTSTAKANKNLWKDLKTRAKALDAKYNKCLDVILSSDVEGKFESDDFTDTTGKQIKRIVNMKDKPGGNTPLHYAVHNWPQGVITLLLRVGANVAVPNSNGDMPLSYIPKDTIEEFLNNYCMDIPKFNDEILTEEDNTQKSNVNSGDAFIPVAPTLNDYQIGLLLDDYKTEMISHSPINFKFGFFSPAISEAQLSQASQNSWELHILKDKTFQLNSLKEMDVMTEICKSKVHKDLVVHPVLKAFTWIKWKLISKHFNRTLRLNVLLAFFLTWFIFDQFGGKTFNIARTLNKVKATNDNSSYREILDSTPFCPPDQEHNLFGNNSVASAIGNWRNRQRGQDWFVFFFVITLILMFWMAMDHRGLFNCSNFGGIMKGPKSHKQVKLSQRMMYLLLSLSTDIFLLFLILITLLGGEHVLWFNILVLGTVYLIREFMQLCSSVLEYITQLDNYFDILQIVMMYVIVAVPNSSITDTCRFSKAVDTDAYDRNCEELQKHSLENCTIKRSLSAWLIVSMWIRFIGKSSKHPKLEKCSLYMSMFWQVAVTFFRFLAFYATFIIAYGLGFYIMLHHDTGNRKGGKNETEDSMVASPTRTKRKANNKLINSDGDDDDPDPFNVPLKSLMKTAVMFLGEIDDLPDKGGNITQVLAHLYMLTFLFLMVMVLMNLLNGMAVSDTGKILQKSQVLGQIELIDTIAYSESVLLNNLTTLQKFGRIQKLGKIGNFFLIIVQKILLASGAMLFESDYMKGREQIILPLQHGDSSDSKIRFFPKAISKWIQKQFKDEDISANVMFDARKIIEDKISKIK